jgi:ABC-type transport system involved in multi-copper enzyme maturation permease subunit
MNAPAALYTIQWLIRDTFRQARASGILYLMTGITIVCMAVCITVRIKEPAKIPLTGKERAESLPATFPRDAANVAGTLPLIGAATSQGVLPGVQLAPLLQGWEQTTVQGNRPLGAVEYTEVVKVQTRNEHVDVPHGYVEILFGAIPPIPLASDDTLPVRTVQIHLAGFVADGVGLLLALIWTAGFLPTFLEPSAVAVLLAKPIPRWSLLAGKFLGVLVYFGFQTTLFIGGTWLALSAATGYWDPIYFFCIPIVMLHFAVFFSFSAMLAVSTRSTAACVIGSIVFWMMCYAMNYGRHIAMLIPELHNMSPAFAFTLEAGYWLFPKPLDFHLILRDVLNADTLFARVVDTPKLIEQGAWRPVWSVVSSLATGVVLLSVAAYDFLTTDY